MNLWLRLMWLLLGTLWRKRAGVLDTTTLRLRVVPDPRHHHHAGRSAVRTEQQAVGPRVQGRSRCAVKLDSVRTTVRCQGRSPLSTSTRPRFESSSSSRKTPPRLGRRRSTSIRSVRSPARAQVAARFSAVVLLPSPALALVTSRVTIGPRRSDAPSRLARRFR